MKSTKFAQSQTNMNDWEYKAERQQEKKANKSLRDARKKSQDAVAKRSLNDTLQ